MKNKIVTSLIAALVLAGGLFAFAATAPKSVDLNLAAAQKAETKAVQNTAPPANAGEYICVKPLDVVANPDMYLNKKSSSQQLLTSSPHSGWITNLL